MTDPEIQLQCLTHALTQARSENQHGNIDRVAEIQTQFYNLVMRVPPPVSETKPEKAPKAKTADKPPDIFK